MVAIMKGNSNKGGAVDAERNMRERRRNSMIARVTLIVLLLALMAGLLCLGAYWGRRYFYVANPHFALRELKVQETAHYNREKVQRIFEALDGGGVCRMGKSNMLDMDTGRLRRELLRDPCVKEVSVKRVLPGSLEVSIAERKAIAYVSSGNMVNALVDESCVVYPFRDSAGLPSSLPYVTGVENVEKIANGEVCADKGMEAAVALIGMLELKPMADGTAYLPHVIKLNYTRERLECTLKPLSGNRIFSSGQAHVWLPWDKAKMRDAIDRFDAILDVKARESGTLSFADMTLQYNVPTRD